MKIVRKIVAGLVAASLILSGGTIANAQSFSSGSSSSNLVGYGPGEFLSDYKQLFRDKGYTIIESPELISEYAGKIHDEREVTYLPNGNGIFSDSFGHVLEGYFPKVQRIKHYGQNIRFDREGTVLVPAKEGERAALDIFSDGTYYYIVVITFNEYYKG